MANQKHHYAFVHNAFGKFIESTRDYFVSDLFPRFNWSVIGTYDKAVEIFNKEQNGPPPQRPQLPALVIDPTGDINLDEARHGSKQLFRFPNLAPGLLNRLYEPIYRDENVLITPGFTRLKGELECVALLNSFYEYFDFRILLLQMFGGLERPIHPVTFDTFIILDSKILSYKYENDVSHVEYEIDWLTNGASEHLVPTTNKNEVIFPCRIRPFYYLMSQGDNSEKYGGTDNIAEYRLSFNITYEIEIPTMILINENLDLTLSERHIKLNINYGSSNSHYFLEDAYNESKLKEEIDKINSRVIFPSLKQRLISDKKAEYTELAGFQYDESGNVIKSVKYAPINESSFESTISSEGEVENVKSIDVELLSRYYHVLTSEQLEEEEFDVDLPIKIEDLDYIINGGFKVNSKFGEMIYKTHFDIVTTSEPYDTLRIYMEDIHGLIENDLIEIFYYRVSEV